MLLYNDVTTHKATILLHAIEFIMPNTASFTTSAGEGKTTCNNHSNIKTFAIIYVINKQAHPQ